MMWIPSIGESFLEEIAPFLESIAPFMPGEVFPSFFTLTLLQRGLVAAVMVTVVSAFLGCFLLIRNLALIGDGLAHVSFGGIAVGIVLGATSPLWYALLFSVTAAILIHELQSRDILTGDASIAIFSTGMLAMGLVALRLEVTFYLPLIGTIELTQVGITNTVEIYIYGNLKQMLVLLRILDRKQSLSNRDFSVKYREKYPNHVYIIRKPVYCRTSYKLFIVIVCTRIMRQEVLITFQKKCFFPLLVRTLRYFQTKFTV